MLGIVLSSSCIIAQEAVTEKNNDKSEGAEHSKFVLAGFAYTGFTQMDNQTSNFGPTGFNPIFLWKKSDKLFFEAEMSVEMSDGVANYDLEYATIHYKLCNYLDISAGKFLSPFGIFNDRIHPSWINKFADKPLGFNDMNSMIGPMSEIGVEFGGGAQIGKSKINYVCYVSNGPTLSTDSMMGGMLMYSNTNDNNDNKAIGGRIGFLPFQNSSLEIGMSGQVAKVGDKTSDLYRNIGTQLMACDLSYFHKLDFIKSNLDIKAQMNMVNVDKAVKYPLNMPGMDSTFDNKSKAFFIQLAVRPAYIENHFIKNLEFAVRYSMMKLPEAAMWGGDYDKITVGVNYWLTWHSVLKFDYQVNNRKGQDSKSGFLIQWGIGF